MAGCAASELKVQLLLERDLTRMEGFWDPALLPAWRTIRVSAVARGEYLLDVASLALGVPKEHMALFVLKRRKTCQVRFGYLTEVKPLGIDPRGNIFGDDPRLVVLCLVSKAYDTRELAPHPHLDDAAVRACSLASWANGGNALLIVKLYCTLTERLLTVGCWHGPETSPLSAVLPWLRRKVRALVDAHQLAPSAAEACSTEDWQCFEEIHHPAVGGIEERNMASTIAEQILFTGDVLIFQAGRRGEGQGAAQGQAARAAGAAIPALAASGRIRPAAVREPSRSRSPRRRRELCRGLWASRKFTDAEVVCEARRFAVHRAVLSQASPVFARAFSGPLREAGERVFEVRGSTPEAVEAMLRYLYTGTLPQEQHAGGWQPLLELAAQYELADLCEKAARALVSCATTDSVHERVQALRRHADHPRVAPSWEAMLDRLMRDRSLLSCCLGRPV